MHPGQLDLNLLRVLNALLLDRNLTRAGQRVGLSQPAVSHALARLRLLFEDELLVREGQRYYLTPVASELVSPVREVLRLIDETITRRPSFDPAVDRRHFRIASSDVPALLLLQPLIQRLEATASGLTFAVRLLAGDTAQQVTDGELDLAIAPMELAPGLSRVVLYEDRLVCAVWAGNENLPERPDMETFLQQRRIAFDWSAYNMPAPQLAWTRRDMFLRMQNSLLPLYMLRGTSLVTLVSQKLGAQLPEAADIRILEPGWEMPMLPLWMFWHPSKDQDPSHAWLRNELISIAAEI